VNNYNYGILNNINGKELMVGGIIGYNYGTIINSNNYGDMNIQDGKNINYLGGITGYNNEGHLIGDVNYGEISNEATDTHIYVGGVCGTNVGKIEKCINSKTGNVYAKSINSYVIVGGIVAYNSYSHNFGNVTSSYNMANVIGYGGGTDNVSKFGGIVGSNKGGIVSNTYTVGNVSGIGANGEYGLGGIAGGMTESATINNSYYLNTIESLYGYTDGTAITITNSSSKTASEMKSSAFVDLLNAGLDEPAWGMATEGINDGYPILSFEVQVNK